MKGFKRILTIILSAIFVLTVALFSVSCYKKELPDITPSDDEIEEPIEIDESNTAFVTAIYKALALGFDANVSIVGLEQTLSAKVIFANSDHGVDVFLTTDIKGQEIKLIVRMNGGKELYLSAFGFDLYANIDNLDQIGSLINDILAVGEENPSYTLDLSGISGILSSVQTANLGELVLSLVGDITGVENQTGGYDYTLALGENLAIDITVDSESNLHSITAKISEGVNLIVDGFTTVGSLPTIPEKEVVTDIETVLATVKAFAQEKVESTQDLIDAIKTLNFNALTGILESKTVSLDLALNVDGVSVVASVGVDFNDGLAITVDGSVNGINLKATVIEDEIYLSSGELKVKATFGTINNYLGLLFKDNATVTAVSEILTKFENGIDIKTLFGLVDLGSANITSIKVENETEVVVALGETVIRVDLATLNISVMLDGVSVNVTELSVGEVVSEPTETYADLAHIDGIVEKVLALVSSQEFNASVILEVNGVTLEVSNLDIVLAEQLKISANVVVKLEDKEITLSVVYDGELYITIGETKLYISAQAISEIIAIVETNKDLLLDTLKNIPEVASVLEQIPSEFNEQVITQIISAISSLTTVDGKVELVATLDGMGISASVSEVENGVSVGLTLDGIKVNGEIKSVANEIVIPEKDGYEDISSYVIDVTTALGDGTAVIESLLKADFNAIIDIVKAESVTVDISANLGNVDINGNVTVDFADGLKVKFVGQAFGLDVTAYLVSGVVYLEVGKVAVKCDIDEIIGYVNAFTENPVALPKYDGSTLTIGADGNGNMTLNVLGANIVVDLINLTASVTYGDINANVISLSASERVVLPDTDYVSLGGLNGVVNKISNQFDQKNFNISGMVNVGNTTIALDGVKIQNKGEGDYQENFDAGKLYIGGNLAVTMGDTALKFGINFIENNLYVVFNDSMKIRFTRESLDNIVGVIMDNSEELLSAFAVAGVESFKDILDGKYSISNLVSMLNAISVTDGTVKLNLDLSLLGFGNVEVGVGLDALGNLTLGVYDIDNSLTVANLTMNNDYTEESALIEPSDASSYMDMSNLDKLVEGFVYTALKDGKAYSLGGKLRVKLPLDSLLGDIIVNVTAKVRIVEKVVDGEVEQSIELHVTWDATDRPNILATTVHDDYLKFGKATLSLIDGVLYMSRMDQYYTQTGIIFKKTTWHDGEYTYKKINADEASPYIMDIICYMTGFSSSLFEGNSTGDTSEPIAYEKILTEYSLTSEESPYEHNLTLNISELLKMSMFSTGTVIISQDENLNLTGLHVEVPIKVVVTITLTLDATHDVSYTAEQGASDFAGLFEELSNHEYASFV